MVKKIKWLVGIGMIAFGLLGFNLDGQAAEGVGLASQEQLKQFMSTPGEASFYLKNDVHFTGTIEVKGNKTLDLDRHVLSTGTGTADQFKITESNASLTLKNGTIEGGNTQSVGNDGAGVINVANRYLNSTINIDGINHTSEKGGFIRANGSDVHFRGNNTLRNGPFNVRAGNMYFDDGVFDGKTTTRGGQDPNSNGAGGINLSFNGYVANLRKKKDRILEISKEATVKLENTNDYGALEYNNNVGNFDLFTVYGTFQGTSIGSSLRTTAASPPSASINSEGTGRSEIHVKPGSTFTSASTARGASNIYGTLFTFSTGLYVDSPKVFDMRYYGNGNFFYMWPDGNKGYFDVRNMDMAVWAKKDFGIGNPMENGVWQDVGYLTIDSFYNTNAGTITSSNQQIKNNFKINDYSRISNDIRKPKLVIDDLDVSADGSFKLPNSAQIMKGSAHYTVPGNNNVGPVANAKVTLTIDKKQYTTVTNEQGEWTFPYSPTDTESSVHYSVIKGGTKAQLRVEDKDERYDEVKGIIVDDIAPQAEPKLLVVNQGTKEGIGANQIPSDPKKALVSYSDETSANSRITVKYDTLLNDRNDLTQEVGFYPNKLKVSLTDEAGNENIVDVPVLVKDKDTTITDSFIVAENFKYDYYQWKKATVPERRDIVLTQGNVKAYTVNLAANEVTEVPHSSNLLQVTWDPEPWQPKKNLPVTIKLKSSISHINAYLDVNEVKMKVNYYLQGTTTRIYSDLKNKTPKPMQEFESIRPEDSIKTTLDNLRAQNQIEIDTTNYTLTTPNYKVFVDDQEVTGDAVPEKDFTVNYYFNGKTLFQDADDIDFGSSQVAKETDILKYTESTSPAPKLTIVNTIPNEKWQLSARISEPIMNKTKNTKFQGSLVFKDQTLTDAALPIMTQDTLDTPLTTINLGQVLEVHQKSGNLSGKHRGKVEWSLVSGPSF
ncbi:hypothetical protein [Vagococcus silagei]|uniref:Uncharacterized protein n=1 Tax=Vagococcus silagei TaxID=2508885 RepID=A0A4S3B4B5_9ENTE|nr:hypothetical protein [Vagococcus silagei]THB60640.1 hypothetical protein ESZ54_09235 [Vagococcus silagei]